MISSDKPSSETHEKPFGILSPLERIRPDLMGFIFHLSWIYLLFYSDAVSSTMPLTEEGGMADLAYLSSMLTLSVTLFVGALKTKTFMYLAQSKLWVSLAPLITAIGTFLYCLYQALPLSSIVVVGGILTGVGSAILAVRWAAIYGNTSPKAILSNFPLILVAIVAICISMEYLPSGVCLLLLIALPLLSGVTLQRASNYQHSLLIKKGLTDSCIKTDKPLPSLSQHTTKRYGGLVVVIALMGLTVGCLPSLSVHGSNLTNNYSILFFLLTSLLVLMCVGIALRADGWSTFITLLVVPSLVLLMLMLPLFRFSSLSLGEAFFPVGNIAFELLLLFGTVMYALLFDLSPAKTFMIGRLTLALSDLAGVMIGDTIAQSGNFIASTQIGSICLFVGTELLIVILVIGYFINRPHAGNIFNPKQKGLEDHAAGKNDTRTTDLSNEKADELSPDSSPEACTHKASLLSDQSATKSMSSLTKQCTLIVARYGLSERESDVLRLLAEGRSSTRIQNDLHIAAGTVNYHSRNIYQKMGIHSKQELLDIVQGETL